MNIIKVISLTGIMDEGPVDERDDKGEVCGDDVRQPVGAAQ